MRKIRIECAAVCHWFGMSLAFLTALTSGHASAEPVEARTEARSHFDQGVGLARRHAYAEALSEFERAYQIFPHFSVLYNIGQALITLDRPTEAIAALTRYLEEGGANIEPSRRQEVAAAIASASARTGSIEVTVDVVGALISIDEKPYGRSPLVTPVRVDGGAHRVLAALDSGERAEANADVRAGQTTPLHLELGQAVRAPVASSTRGQLSIRCAQSGLSVLVDDQPLAVTPLASPLSLDAGAHRVRFERGAERSGEQQFTVLAQRELALDCSLPVALAAAPAERAAPAPAAHHSTQKTLAYVVGAAGIALTGAAAAHFLWNRARYEDWQSRYSAYYNDPTDQNRESANSLAQSVANASVVTVGLAIGAGVALGTSAVLLFTSRPSGGAPTPAANRGVGGPFMTLRGTF